MIIYLDTSSLVKLYVEEVHSDAVRRWMEEAEILTTCRIAYPEMVSALNRRLRQGDISKKEYNLLTAKFFKEWIDFAVIDFSEIEAGDLIDKYGLRGFDAVHLSAAKLLKDKQTDIALSFSSFDEKLNKAASSEGFTILSP
ncbi:MAG: type II toxin-antitoxin system VapC family toxin [Deltaproteobacteria bacterium]|nr:type II toxin-antitoxin system VapC family toxin [Deltaproteobacteria bacterium]